MGLDLIDTSFQNIAQRIIQCCDNWTRKRTDLEISTHVVFRFEIVIRCELCNLPVAVLAPLKLIQTIFADIKESQTEISHQPLIAGGCAEVDARSFYIDWYCTYSLNDISINQCTARVCEIANCFKIVLKAIDSRHQ